MYSLIIHGGAGGTVESLRGRKDDIHASLRTVLEEGRKCLEAGASALDTVELCVRLLEDNPIFNAGYGAVPTNEGLFEMDASIMDGQNLKAGAVASVRNIRNPVSLARLVMEKTQHVLLVDRGAQEFAQVNNITIEPDSYFREALEKTGAAEEHEKEHGTVGAVVQDQQGNIAAATSTGGVKGQINGRVGDTPLIGSGNYADNQSCGVSCTGIGEHFIRTVLAHRVSVLLTQDGLSAQDATDQAMTYMLERIDGKGGIIAIDRNGKVGRGQTTEFMRHGWIEQGGETFTALHAKEALGKS